MAVILRILPVLLLAGVILLGFAYLYRELLKNFIQPLSLQVLLNKFGTYWTKKSSRSGYKRHYRTDGRSYLMLWEGESYRGKIDSVNRFDREFYDQFVQGENGLFLLNSRFSQVEVNFNGKSLGRYPNLQKLEEAMEDEWRNLSFPTGEQVLQQIQKSSVLTSDTLEIDAVEPNIEVVLQRYGENWVAEDPNPLPDHPKMNRHYEVRTTPTVLSLIVWIGTEDGEVYKPSDEHQADAVVSVVTKKDRYEVIARESGFFFRAGDQYRTPRQVARGIEKAWKKLEFRNFPKS